MKYTLNINPVPASRPKVSKYSTYYGKKYTAFRKEVKPLIEELNLTPLEGPVTISLTFNVSKPKTSKLDYPHFDLDNAIKAICDSLNGYLYVDDRQIVHLLATKQFVEGDGSIVIEIV